MRELFVCCCVVRTGACEFVVVVWVAVGVVMGGGALSIDSVVSGLGFFMLVWIERSCELPCALCG